MAAVERGAVQPGVLTPEVTVVVPTQNRRELLAACLRSVLGQRDIDIEVIVVDDGSTDDTSDWVKGLQDPRIRLVTNHIAGGVAHARNTGIDLARAPWVAFVDDDDLWAPDKLRSQIATANAMSAAFVYCGAVCFTTTHAGEVQPDRPAPPPEKLYEALLQSNVLPGGASAQAIRTENLRAAGGFDPDLHLLADWDLWLRIAAVVVAARVNRPLVAYRMHGGNMVASRAGAHLRESERFCRKHQAAGRPVRFDASGFSHWIAGGQLRSGHRLTATKVHLSAALRHRDVHHLGCAVRAPFGERFMGLGSTPPCPQPAPTWLRQFL